MTALVDTAAPLPHVRVMWPWIDIDVGATFLMPRTSIKSAREQCSRASKKYNRTFRAKPEDGGSRVWRIA